MYLHLRDTIVIPEEGDTPHPLCNQCVMFVPWKYLNGRHPRTVMYKQGAEKKRCILTLELARVGADTEFLHYAQALVNVKDFK